MAKKMYDILPPKATRTPKKAVKKVPESKVNTPVLDLPELREATFGLPKSAPKSTVQKNVRALESLPKKRKFPLRELLAGFLVIAILLGVYGYIKLPKVEVKIWPNVTPLNLSEKITADTSVKTVDAKALIIPAEFIQIQKDAEQEFPASGIASENGKAAGTIIIYNKISPASPFTLIKGTHFLSDSGKYFVTLAKVVIPAAKNKVPGSVSVQVQAEGSGEDYNIKAAKFSVPKLNGTAYYYSIYGESENAMTGGYTGKVKKVTSDDLSNAKEIVTKKLITDTQNALKESLSSDQILLEGAIETAVVEAGANVTKDMVADTFKERATVKASGIAFKKQDIDEFIKQYIASHLPEDSMTLEESKSMDYTLESFNPDKGQALITLTFNASTYSDINTNDIVEVLPLKSADQIKETIDQMYPGKISELKVNFWPFWVNSAPKNTDRIKANLNF